MCIRDRYWRLNVMTIDVPPLRNRSGDIRLLATDILERLRIRDPDLPARVIEESTLRLLDAYRWPGNVRELENAIHRAAVVAGGAIGPEHLPADLRSAQAAPSDTAGLPAFSHRVAPLELLERIYVEWVVDRAGGDIERAAESLDIPPAAVRAVLSRGPSITDSSGRG